MELACRDMGLGPNQHHLDRKSSCTYPHRDTLTLSFPLGDIRRHQSNPTPSTSSLVLCYWTPAWYNTSPVTNLSIILGGDQGYGRLRCWGTLVGVYLFVWLRPCLNCRGLTVVMVKYPHPIPLVVRWNSHFLAIISALGVLAHIN